MYGLQSSGGPPRERPRMRSVNALLRARCTASRSQHVRLRTELAPCAADTPAPRLARRNRRKRSIRFVPICIFLRALRGRFSLNLIADRSFGHKKSAHAAWCRQIDPSSNRRYAASSLLHCPPQVRLYNKFVRECQRATLDFNPGLMRPAGTRLPNRPE